MRSITFEWDERKSASNLKKHGVSFEEAVTVFSDDLARLIPDPDSEGEQRFILLGMSARLRLLVVCHCERGSEIIRIISARKVDKSEWKQYEGYHHA
ncbi:BrnT family toxin [Thiolapillus sp.]